MIELEDRLANYRDVLDDAIGQRMAERRPGGGTVVSVRDEGELRRSNRALVLAAAALALVIGGFVVGAQREASRSEQTAVTMRDGRVVAFDVLEPIPSAAPPIPPESEPLPAPEVVGPAIPALAIGDSVMLGAAPALQELGFAVDATESRDFINGLDAALTLEQQGRLGDTVVLHLGTNGPIAAGDMDRMMDALSDVPNVVLVLNSLPASYTYGDGNNALMIDAAMTNPNTTALYWNDLVDTCPGECLYDDQIHLRPDGQEYYAALIANALGL